MNHVPDEALAAVDAFGRGLLDGDPPPVVETLPEDLRLEIRVVDAGVARCRYEIRHTRAPPTLRAYDDYLATVVDGVDERLTRWGVRPPPAYEHVGSADGRHRYEGRLDLP